MKARALVITRDIMYNRRKETRREANGLRRVRRVGALLLLVTALCARGLAQEAPGTVVPPAYPVPEYVAQLLSIATAEVGYTEERGGLTKYGEWVGAPYTQWCAEYLCWCVDQTDKQFGTSLLNVVYPLYSGTNTGLNWFLRQGRYIARTGSVAGWGSQWFKGETETMEKNEYVPQPGDWAFFSIVSSGDTTHVAMVEYCSQDASGTVTVHVLEGNMPDRVARNAYPLDDWRILGYGTVHDLADIVLRGGNEGEKVRALQEKLTLIGLLDESAVDGRYGSKTAEAVKQFQTMTDKTPTGIANHHTQTALDTHVAQWYLTHDEYWLVDEP